jgi:hypothetical protein
MTEEPIQTKRLELMADLQTLNEPITITELIDILGSTVKQDNSNKAITFLTMILTYTAEDQINLAFLAESSTGKSYIPLELTSYFPKQDVMEHGYVSPTAFFHDYGTYDNETHTITVNMERKIIVYLDQPHDELLKRMRPMLSHDRKKIRLKITDRKEKSGTRTKNVDLIGYATHIYCSVRYNLDEQDKTRQLLLSPEVTQEKIREAVWLRLSKEGNRQGYEVKLLQDPKRQRLMTRVDQVRTAHIDYINVPEDIIKQIGTKFLEQHPNLQARQTRDITRLLAIIKGHGLLNYMHRTREGNSITVNQEDVDVGFSLYGEISEANEIGLPPELYKIYTDLKPTMDEYGQTGFSRRDFQKDYWQKYRKYLGRKVENILKTLADVGLIAEEQDPGNKRQWRYVSQGVCVPPNTNTNNEDELVPSVYTPPVNHIVLVEGNTALLTPSVNHILSCSLCKCEFASIDDLDNHMKALHPGLVGGG